MTFEFIVQAAFRGENFRRLTWTSSYDIITIEQTWDAKSTGSYIYSIYFTTAHGQDGRVGFGRRFSRPLSLPHRLSKFGSFDSTMIISFIEVFGTCRNVSRFDTYPTTRHEIPVHQYHTRTGSLWAKVHKLQIINTRERPSVNFVKLGIKAVLYARFF